MLLDLTLGLCILMCVYVCVYIQQHFPKTLLVLWCWRFKPDACCAPYEHQILSFIARSHGHVSEGRFSGCNIAVLILLLKGLSM